ncbi:signal peptide peptidase SppA [Helicobacter muridarum]|uniref:Signal peptide protease IV n=1 Tax=Helicobacter muridarum TaxID=216 RepID=A0A377PW19_9HELI|nr:signal peptide peptidase SppA [Helicobacter muridarum]STQ86451.1 signal peptide protease IV [Helicobacter muridarum]
MGLFRSVWCFIVKVLDFFTKYFKGMIIVVVLLFILSVSLDNESSPPPNLAKIHLNYAIMDSAVFREQIELIKKNPSIKGVLLIINSPGGGVGASVEIADMIKELQERVPVVAYVQSLMASGAYYAGMYSSYIYANRGALIGSIGVIFASYNIGEVLDKIGISTQGVKAGTYKEAGTITRKWDNHELDMIETLTQQNYKMFYSDVIEARGDRLKDNNPKVFADGRVFNAASALDLGLIDGIASQDKAILHLQELAGIKYPIWLKKPKLQSYIDSLVDSSLQRIMSLSSFQMQAIWR